MQENKYRRFAPELNNIKEFMAQLERLLNAHSEKLHNTERFPNAAPLYELLWRMMEQIALLQESGDASFVTAVKEETLKQSRRLLEGSGITLTDKGPGRDLIIEAAPATGILGLDVSYQRDDFMGGTDSQNPATTAVYDGGAKSGSLGELGWTVGVNPDPPGAETEAGYVASSATLFPHSTGILALSAAVDGDRIWITAPARVTTATPSFGVGWMSNLAFEMRWVFHFQDLSRNSIFRVGFIEAFTGVPPANPPAGAYIEFDDAVDTNYQYVYDNGATHAKTDSGIPVGTGVLKMHLVKITHSLNSAQLGFSLDDRAPTFIPFYSSGYPPIAPYAESQFGAGGSALAFLRLDFYDCLISGLSRY